MSPLLAAFVFPVGIGRLVLGLAAVVMPAGLLEMMASAGVASPAVVRGADSLVHALLQSWGGREAVLGGLLLFAASVLRARPSFMVLLLALGLVLDGVDLAALAPAQPWEGVGLSRATGPVLRGLALASILAQGTALAVLIFRARARQR